MDKKQIPEITPNESKKSLIWISAIKAIYNLIKFDRES